MIFEIHEDHKNVYYVFNEVDTYRNNAFELCKMLSDCYERKGPNDTWNWLVVCFDGYENALEVRK